jgi:ADP-heptose:LPS heptosyltransferase
MLSGVLKQCIDKNPGIKYNLVRRRIYQSILDGHPAIKTTGFPDRNANIITTDYWAKEKLGGGQQRAYQILARVFGLETPVEEKLFLPGTSEEDRLFYEFLPNSGKKIIVIAPSSNSPRKALESGIWHDLVHKLNVEGFFVLQVGKKNERYIKGAYSLLGLTTPRQLIALLNKCHMVISLDNFVMHAAHLIKIPSVIIWGPTEPEVYGYDEQVHIQNVKHDCAMKNSCLGPDYPENYATPCPLKKKICMQGIKADLIFDHMINMLN